MVADSEADSIGVLIFIEHIKTTGGKSRKMKTDVRGNAND